MIFHNSSIYFSINPISEVSFIYQFDYELYPYKQALYNYIQSMLVTDYKEND